MSVALAHKVLSGDRVRVSLTEAGGLTATVLMPAAALRAKAWGILADIDPEGVDEVRTEAPVAYIPGRNGVALMILTVLERGPATQSRIRALTGLTMKQVVSSVLHFTRNGRMERRDGAAGRGSRASWAITPLGRRWLDERRALS
jgi:DNA-binding HxlR family transcriptional regulator